MKTTAALTEMLNTDFCPWANRYVYWLKRPLGILVVAAGASLLCGIFVAPQGLVIAAAIATTIVLGIAWPWIGLRGLACELRFPQQRGVEGQAVAIEVMVRNRWPFPVWGLAIEDGFFLPRADGDDSTAVALAGIRGWSRTTFQWSFVPECRGIYPIKQAKIATEFPFGVWKSRRDLVAFGKLTVWPGTVSLEPAAFADGSSRSLLQPSERMTGSEGDRSGVRAFREGDSLRFVHWAQTAKSGRLIVSERQGPAHSSAVIAIDTDPGIAHGAGKDSSFETSIRIAASLCEQITRQNVSVRMVANRTAWDVRPTDLSRRSSLDRLAALENTMPLNLAREGHDRTDSFVITTSEQNRDWGPKWRSIVLANFEARSNDQSSSLRTSPDLSAWIHVELSSAPLHAFAAKWKQAMRSVWRGSARRSGVA